jgi:hypothetical protein
LLQKRLQGFGLKLPKLKLLEHGKLAEHGVSSLDLGLLTLKMKHLALKHLVLKHLALLILGLLTLMKTPPELVSTAQFVYNSSPFKRSISFNSRQMTIPSTFLTQMILPMILPMISTVATTCVIVDELTFSQSCKYILVTLAPSPACGSHYISLVTYISYSSCSLHIPMPTHR